MWSGSKTVLRINSLQVILDTSIVTCAPAGATATRQNSNPAAIDFGFITIGAPTLMRFGAVTIGAQVCAQTGASDAPDSSPLQFEPYRVPQGRNSRAAGSGMTGPAYVPNKASNSS